MPVIRSQVVLVVYTALVITLSGFYFLSYPIPGFFLRLREILTAIFFLWWLASLGKKILNRMGMVFPEGDESDEFLWSVGIGGIPVSLGLLFLGIGRGFHPAFILCATILGLIYSRKEFYAWAQKACCTFSQKKIHDAITQSSPVLIITGVVVAGMALLCAFAPPTYYDSLVYHLALPAKYLQEGKIGFIPYNHYSHFPQNMEMIFAWFLALGDDISSHIFNVLLAALLGWVMHRLSLLLHPQTRIQWPLFLFLSAPCVILLSTETYVEIPLAFWTLLSIWGCVKGLEIQKTELPKGPTSSQWFLLSGLMAGFATGIKYTGIITPFILFLLILLWPREQPLKKRVMDAVCLFVPALIVFLPWMIKNFIFTGGNPVFPFLPKLFHAANVYLSQESANAYFRVLDEYRGTSSFLVEIFYFPFRLATDPMSFGGGFDVTGDLGWILPIFLFPLFFFIIKGNKTHWFFLVYTITHIVIWISLRPVLRFLFPIFPLVCLMAGMGVEGIMSRTTVWTKRAIILFVSLFVISNIVLFYLFENERDPFLVSLGLETRKQYLSRKIDGYYGLDYINQTLPVNSRVFLVGDQRGYYTGHPYLAPMALLPQPLRLWADEAENGEQLRKKLLELNFTHLFYHRKEAARLKSYGVLDLTDHGFETWGQMLQKLPILYNDASVTVYLLGKK